MNFSKKLQIVKQISKLTQEELAGELNVSFATLNSWINNKSIPRKKHQETIDDLYRKLTGQRTIPHSELLAKKTLIVKKSHERKSILNHILRNPDIYEELVLQITYNTNRIEGSTLTQAETAAILFDNRSLPNRTLIEQLEAKNHQTAFEYLLNWLQHSEKDIDESLILKLHSILMNGIISDAGTYRKHPVRIVGANVPTTNYVKVPEQMGKLVKEITNSVKDIIAKTAEIHSKFEQIHPFSDGNGRIGRLLIQAMLLKKNIGPALIKQENRGIYIKYLNRSQMKNDHTPLENFLCDAILSGLDLINRSN